MVLRVKKYYGLVRKLLQLEVSTLEEYLDNALLRILPQKKSKPILNLFYATF